MKLAFARRLAANASLALLLSMAFAGVVTETAYTPATASASACPSGWTFTQRTASTSDVPWPVYCQKNFAVSTSTQVTSLSPWAEEVHVEIYGAPGGSGGGDAGVTGGASGSVGKVAGTVGIPAGANLQVSVGGAGTNGYASGPDPAGGPAGGFSSMGFTGGAGGPRGCSFAGCGADRGGAGLGAGGGAGSAVSFSARLIVAGGAGGGGGANCFGCSNPNGDIQGNGEAGQTAQLYRAVGTYVGGNGVGDNSWGYRFNASAGGGGGGIRGGNGGAVSLKGGNAGLNTTASDLVTSYVAANTIPRPPGDTSTGGLVVLRFAAMPAVASVTNDQGTVSNQTSYSFTVTFSEPITGFGLEDVQLTGTAGSVSGWNLSFTEAGDGRTFFVRAVHANSPSGTIALNVLGTGVVAGDRTGVSSLSSTNLTIDRTPPTVVSSVFNPTGTAGQLEVIMTFSETVSNTVDWSAFTFSGTSVGWSSHSAVISGRTLKFLISNSSLVDDTTLNYSLWTGFVKDLNGNSLVAAHMDSLAIDLDPVAVTISSPVATFSSSVTVAVNFAAPVTGLATGDFSFASNTTGCSITGLTGSGSSYQLTVGTCTAGGAGQFQLALTGSAAVSLLGAPSPAVRIFSPTISYDARVPVAGLVSKTISGTVASYVISFSEPITGLNASRISISHSVLGGASGWSISSFLDLGNNFYSFTVNNSAAPNGTVSFSFTAGVTDTIGNPLSSPTIGAGSVLTLENLPTFDPGAGGPIARVGTKIAPSFDLNSRNLGNHGIRIEITNAQAGDTLAFTNQSGIIRGADSTNTVLFLESSSQLSDATWEAAIQSIVFSTSSTATVSRSIQYHLKPVRGYDYVTGTYFRFVPDSGATDITTAQTRAATQFWFGMQGYLATPSTLTQQRALVAAGPTSGPSSLIAYWIDMFNNTGTEIRMNNNGIPRDMALDSSFAAWHSGEPNFDADQFVHVFEFARNYNWNDINSTGAGGWVTGYVTEFGLRAGDPTPTAMIRTQTHTPDFSTPFVTRVSGINGDYQRGDAVEISVQFNKAVVVAGSNATESRLEVLPGVFAEYLSGSGTSVLKYRLVVPAGATSSDLSYVSTSSLTIGSRTITDMIGNIADLTLPAPGTANSLISQSNVAINGNVLGIRMNVPSTSSTQSNVLFVLSSTVALNCNSLSAADFTFTNLNSSSFAVSPSGNSTSCTITLPHSIPKASFGTAMLSASTSFQVATPDGATYSALTIVANSIAVSNPADAGKGEVILDDSGLNGRQRPNTLVKQDPTGLFPGASAGARGILAARNVIAPPAGVTLPELEIMGDFRQLSNMNEVVTARREKVIRAGDSVIAKMMVPPAHSSQYKVLSYMNVNSGFVYMGEKDFDPSGEVTSDPLVFTEPGQYFVRMYVVAKSATAGTDYPAVLFSNNSSPSYFGQYFNMVSVNSTPTYISQAQLDSIVSKQSLELVLIIAAGDTVPVTVTPAPAPVAPVAPITSTPSASPTPTVTPTPSPSATPSATPKPTPTAKPTVKPSPSATPSTAPSPSATPTATPSATAAPSEPEEELVAAPESTTPPEAPAAVENLVAPIDLFGTFGVLSELGAPVADPALGATGDDDAPPVAFDPMGSEESIQAVMAKTTQAVAIVAAIAAAAAAAAGAAGAAAAASSAAGSSVRVTTAPESSGSGPNDSGDSGEIAELEIAHDQIQLEKTGWGDRLAMWAIPALTFLDRLSNRLTVWFAPFSPLLSKVTNDGAYLRAMFGSTTLVLPAAGFAVAIAAIADNGGEILTPTWELLLIIALIGILDAFGGFVAVMTFAIGSLLTHGSIPELSDWRLLIAVIVIGVGPALLTTAFRQLRKLPAHGASEWWERLSDLAVAPFMSGWSIATMVSVLPAVTGLTVNAANHVLDFGIWVAAFAVLRVVLEEIVARYYPQRLDRINPTHIPDSPIGQKLVALGARYALWVLFTGALIGNTWQSWVGSALFVLPTVIGWYQDRFPNVPWLWRILPSGIPGLAFSIVLASFTTAIVGQFLGVNREFAEWAFVLLPLPMLLISILTMFGRFGRTEDEDRPIKKVVWLYRVGGVVMLILTLRLVGII